MSLPKEYLDELNALNKEIKEKQPQDLIQFAANYFNRRLEEQRKHQWANQKQAPFPLFPGIATQSQAEEDGPQFKSPFRDNDPHTQHHDDGPQDSIFKGGFAVGQAAQHSINTPLDPSEPVAAMKAAPRRSVVVPLPTHFNANRRTSVSGETLKPAAFDENWKPDITEKTEDQLVRLQKAVGKNFLFTQLDEEAKHLVIGSLKEKSVAAGETIIAQGDEGDFFYIVESGTVEFYVNRDRVNTAGPGSSFGELALMYNSPRAATVVATTPCVLWALDRLTFRRILLGGSFKKRLLYEDLLKSMPVLKQLTTYDRAKLADALDTEIYQAGDVIIKEGDTGENFYFIEYGEAEVSKGSQTLVKLGKGDYFGEVALLNDLPRQATVTALSKVKVATLGKSGFQRLLGSAVEVLKLQDPTRH